MVFAKHLVIASLAFFLLGGTTGFPAPDETKDLGKVDTDKTKVATDEKSAPAVKDETDKTVVKVADDKTNQLVKDEVKSGNTATGSNTNADHTANTGDSLGYGEGSCGPDGDEDDYGGYDDDNTGDNEYFTGAQAQAEEQYMSGYGNHMHAAQIQGQRYVGHNGGHGYMRNVQAQQQVMSGRGGNMAAYQAQGMGSSGNHNARHTQAQVQKQAMYGRGDNMEMAQGQAQASQSGNNGPYQDY